MEKVSTSPWASEAKEHCRKYRLKMYRALEVKGTLNKSLNNAVEQTKVNNLVRPKADRTGLGQTGVRRN